MDIVPTGNASANEFSIGSTPPPLTDPSPVQASSAPSASATASARRDSLTFVQRWARPTIVEARQLCYLSIGLTILTTVIGLAVAVAGKSAATLGYSLESAVVRPSMGSVSVCLTHSVVARVHHMVAHAQFMSTHTQLCTHTETRPP